MMEFRLEIQLRAAVDLYASIVASGMGLPAPATSRLQSCAPAAVSKAATANYTGNVVSIRIEISFLDDMTLHSLLMTGAPLA